MRLALMLILLSDLEPMIWWNAYWWRLRK